MGHVPCHSEAFRGHEMGGESRAAGGHRERYAPRATIRRARPDEAALLSALALRSKAYWGYDTAFIEACVAALTIVPESVELWQERPDRLHDRLRYRRDGERWIIERLSP